VFVVRLPKWEVMLKALCRFDDKQLRAVWSHLVYLWCYLLRRGPQAVRRRLEVLKNGRTVITQAHVETGFLAAVHISGGIGDQIVIARFLRDVAAQFPEIRFDIFSNDLPTTRWAFGENPSFRNAYIDSLFSMAQGKYDYALEIADTLTRVSRGAGTQERFDVLLHRADRYNEANKETFALGSRGRNVQAVGLVCANVKRHTALHHITGIAYGGDQMAMETDPMLLRAHGIQARRYITVHNGFGTNQVTVGRRSTKCYPHFDTVISLMRLRHPKLVFVQLGARNSEPLRGADIRLLGASTMPQVGALLAGAALHLDNESGLVHIARCYGTRSCVVFGPTNPDYFGYEANVAVRPAACGGCWWTTNDWMNSCPRGFAAPICTDRSEPDAVAKAAVDMLADACPLAEIIEPVELL
jgi:ADP-heptose:LPS heptosyltransferase